MGWIQDGTGIIPYTDEILEIDFSKCTTKESGTCQCMLCAKPENCQFNKNVVPCDRDYNIKMWQDRGEFDCECSGEKCNLCLRPSNPEYTFNGLTFEKDYKCEEFVKKEDK